MDNTPATRLFYDLYQAYHERGRESDYPPEKERMSFSDQAGLWSIEELLDGREPAFSYVVEIDSDPWLLLAIEGALHLFRFSSSTESEMHVLGSLAGGTYSERLNFEKLDQETIEMRFEHPRLPGVLLAKVQRHRVSKQDKRMREMFRNWAASASIVVVQSEREP